MLVCAYGEVSEYCEKHDMVIMDHWTGDLLNYAGEFPVLVTDKLDEREYLYYKGKLSERGVELVSVHHSDIGEFYAQPKERNRGGRNSFGFRDGKLTVHGRTVVGRILELFDKGYGYKQIRDDEKVNYPDGRKISTRMIREIVDNRERYEKEGL